MAHKGEPSCIRPLEAVQETDTGDYLDAKNSVSVAIHDIIVNPGAILGNIIDKIQGNPPNYDYTGYEKKIPSRQLDGWQSLSESQKQKMMALWPKGLHAQVKLEKQENHTLEAILFALKTHKSGYVLLSNMTSIMGNLGYGVLFGSNSHTYNGYSVMHEEIAGGDFKKKSKQLGDRVLSIAYSKMQKDASAIQRNQNVLGGIYKSKDEDDLANTADPTMVLMNILGISLETRSDMSKWEQGKSFGVFQSFHKSDAQETLTFNSPEHTHVHIITSFDSKKDVVHFVDAHDTNKKNKMDLSLFMRLPNLQITYGYLDI